MGLNRGRAAPAGVSTLVSIFGTPDFSLNVYGWKKGANLPTIPRSGRGGPRFGSFRGMNVGGEITLIGGQPYGDNPANGFPVPVAIENSAGTITLQYDSGKTVILNGEITGYTTELSGKTKDNWEYTVTMKLGAEPLYQGWGGSQASPAAIAVSNQQTDEGLSKTLDANNIGTRATQRFDGLIADSDAAEIAFGQQYLLSAAPVPSVKTRTLTVTRTDRSGGAVVRDMALNDTADDVLNPNRRHVIDPYDLETHFTSTYLKSPMSAIPPMTDTTLYRINEITSAVVNPLVTNVIGGYGKSNSKDRQLLPKQFVSVDPNHIDSFASNAALDGTPTIQSGFKVLALRTDNPVFDHTVKVVTGALLDSKDKITFPKTMRFDDPAGLMGYASSAILSAVPLPMVSAMFTRLSAYGVKYEKVTDTIIVKTTEYQPQTSAQKIANEAMVSTRASLIPWTDIVCDIVACTPADTAESLATSYWNSFQGSTYSLKVQVKKLNNYEAQILYYFWNPGITVEGLTTGGGRLARSQISSGTAQFFVSLNLARGSGTRLIQLSRAWIQSAPRRRFTVRRLISGTSIPEFASQIGTTNNSTFLGLPAGTVLYEGPTYSTNISLSSTINYAMGYQFFTDSLGLSDQIPDIFFTQPQTITTSSTATGWVNASTIGLSSYVNNVTQTDFSVFV